MFCLDITSFCVAIFTVGGRNNHLLFGMTCSLVSVLTLYTWNCFATGPAFFTGLPYGNPSRKKVAFVRCFFFFFRVGKSLDCHSPAKWCLCA